MAGLLDALFNRGNTAQMPGAMSQPSGLAKLFAPEVALPMAAALLGQQGNGQNFSNAFAAGGQAFGQQKQLQAQTAKENQTLEFFKQKAPEYAEMVAAGMPVNEAWKQYTEQRYAQKGQGIINAGAGNLYDSSTGQWLSAPGGGAEGVAGLTPVWLRDRKTGAMKLGQMTKDGRVIESELNPDLEPVGPYDKAFETNRGAKAGEAVGAAEGQLPGVTQMAQIINQQVEDLKNDPYLPNMLGPIQSRLPTITADGARVQGKMDQLQGGAFLQARQMLKGGGAITDYEGVKAEAAYARLKTAQNEADYKAALDEFNRYVQQGLQKLQAQASQTRMGGAVPPAPAGGPRRKTSTGVEYEVKP